MGCSSSMPEKAVALELPRQNAKEVIVLSTDEKALIQETWKLIEPYQGIIGKTCFLRFFEEHPAYQNLFPEFRNLNKEELKRTRALYGHARRVMKAIENAVTSMDDVQTFATYLEDLGGRHQKRALKQTHLLHMQDAFIYAIRQVLASQWTSDISMVWNKMFQFVANKMLHGCKNCKA